LGSNGFDPQDVAQGSIGNCWFLAAASAVAEVPERFATHWLTTDFNDAGIYAIKMYSLGVPITVIVDDWVPHYGTTYQTIFAKVQKNGTKSTWPVILEKAFAKLMGNYAQLIGGWAERGVSQLTGFPSTNIRIENETPEAIWEKLDGHDSVSDIMTASSNYNAAGHSSSDTNGIAYSHAYTVLGTEEVELTDGSKQRLIKLRNPWQRENYKGPFSDVSEDWARVSTSEKERIGFGANKYDGIFYMPPESFKESFSYAGINYDLTSYHQNYWMRLNDPLTAEESPGNSYYCGSTCTSHTFIIKSEVAQKIYISANLHESRSYPTDCKPTSNWTGMKYRFSKPQTYQTGMFDG
jgi:hypothetical protein